MSNFILQSTNIFFSSYGQFFLLSVFLRGLQQYNRFNLKSSLRGEAAIFRKRHRKRTPFIFPAESLFLPAKLSTPKTSADYSPCMLPNMPQTGAITAQNRGSLFAPHSFDRIFAHRPRKAAPPRSSHRQDGLFPVMSPICSIAFLLGSRS